MERQNQNFSDGIPLRESKELKETDMKEQLKDELVTDIMWRGCYSDASLKWVQRLVEKADDVAQGKQSFDYFLKELVLTAAIDESNFSKAVIELKQFYQKNRYRGLVLKDRKIAMKDDINAWKQMKKDVEKLSKEYFDLFFDRFQEFRGGCFTQVTIGPTESIFSIRIYNKRQMLNSIDQKINFIESLK